MSFIPVSFRLILNADAGGQNSAAGVTLTVKRLTDDTVADIFSDVAGIVGIDNPYVTDSNGKHPSVSGSYYVEYGHRYGVYIGATMIGEVAGSSGLAAVAFSGDFNDLSNTPAAAIPLSQKGAASGVAELGVDGKVPTAQLPASSSGFTLVTATANLSANSSVQVFATGSSVDLTMTGQAAGVAYTVANHKDSTQVVRVLNPSASIKGFSGTIVAGDNVVIEAGTARTIIVRGTNLMGIF